MSKRIIESMRHFRYFKKLRQTRKESRSHFFSQFFLSKTPQQIENKKPNVNFIFKFSDYKSLNLETSEDIFIKELKKINNEELKLTNELNTFYNEKENESRNINLMMNILNRNKKCRRYFKYNEINDELIKNLLTFSNYKFFKKDSIIFKAGSKQNEFYFLIRGKISLRSMNTEIIRRNININKYELDNIYNNIKEEEKFNLQNISEDEISEENFISKTNVQLINPNEIAPRIKGKLSIKSTSSKNNTFFIRRSKDRVATLKLQTFETPKVIVQEKILIENFTKIQKDLSSIVKTYEPGDFFCDWEIILDKPHTETAYAEEDTDLLILQKKYFDKFFSNHFIKTDNKRKLFLTKRIEFLHINNVINLKPEFYDKGKVIYTKFDPANQFFVIYKGQGSLMDFNQDYIYRKKSDVIYNVKDLKLVCYVGEGCVVGLESFNDGKTKYDNNFVIEEDNTVIYRIKMNNIRADNVLKKKNRIKLQKQLNELYLSQNEMLPKVNNNKRLTREEKIYKKKEEKINDVFYNAKGYFLKRLTNEKRIKTVFGDLNQITEMNDNIKNKQTLLKKTIKSSEKQLPSIETDSSPNFKRKFHFLTMINKAKKRLSGTKGQDTINITHFKNNLKNTLELKKSDKKENSIENNNSKNNNIKKPVSVPKRFSMFSFNFKSSLFKNALGDKNNNKSIETKKEETFFDFYGDTNNDFFKTTNSKFKQKKKITSDFVDKYISKTIKVKKDDINYNSGNFKIPLFGSPKTKK